METKHAAPKSKEEKEEEQWKKIDDYLKTKLGDTCKVTSEDDWVSIEVSGTVFKVSMGTLSRYPHSQLTTMAVEFQKGNQIQWNRQATLTYETDPVLFNHVLCFYRGYFYPESLDETMLCRLEEISEYLVLPGLKKACALEFSEQEKQIFEEAQEGFYSSLCLQVPSEKRNGWDVAWKEWMQTIEKSRPMRRLIRPYLDFRKGCSLPCLFQSVLALGPSILFGQSVSSTPSILPLTNDEMKRVAWDREREASWKKWQDGYPDETKSKPKDPNQKVPEQANSFASRFFAAVDQTIDKQNVQKDELLDAVQLRSGPTMEKQATLTLDKTPWLPRNKTPRPTMDNETYSRLVLGDNNTDNVKPRIKSSVVTGDPSRFGLTSQSAEDATEVKAFCGWDSDSPVNEHAPSFAENAHRLRRMPLTTTTPSKESSQTIELNQPRVNMVTVDLSRFGLTKESSQNNTTTVNIDEGHVAPEQEANMDPNRKPFDPPLPNMPRTLAETRDFLRKRHLASSSSSSSSSSFSYPQVPAAMAKFDKDGFPIDTEENLNDSLSIDKKKGI